MIDFLDSRGVFSYSDHDARRQNNRLSEIIRERFGSIVSAADLTGIPETTLANWTSGRSVPDAIKADFLCRVLDCTVEDIWPWPERRFG